MHYNLNQMPSLVTITRTSYSWPERFTWFPSDQKNPFQVYLTRGTTSCLTCHMAKALWVRVSFSKSKSAEIQLILSLRKIWPTSIWIKLLQELSEKKVKLPSMQLEETGTSVSETLGEDSKYPYAGEKKRNQAPCNLLGHTVPSQRQNFSLVLLLLSFSILSFPTDY